MMKPVGKFEQIDVIRNLHIDTNLLAMEKSDTNLLITICSRDIIRRAPVEIMLATIVAIIITVTRIERNINVLKI
jgi:hypothetical protein